MNKLTKKILSGLLGASLIVSAMGITAFAAVGELQTHSGGGTYEAVLTNKASTTRYCELFLKEGYTFNTSTTKSSQTGNLVPNDFFYASTTMDYGGPYMFAYGAVHYGATPESAVEWSQTKQY